MATAATIAARLTLDTESYDKGLSSATKQIGGFSNKIGDIGGKMRKMGTIMTASVTAPIVAGFTKMTMAASDMEEATSAIEMVFGEAGSAIEKFSETSANAVGLSALEFKQLSTVTGSFLQNLGYDADEAAKQTIVLTERASDMAAVFNTDVSTALEAIQSGLKGEMNPLENFGVKLNAAAIEAKALSMGLAETKGELDDNAKAQATLALIMEQTNRIQGTFSNEAEGLSGQLKILKANVEDGARELGAVLLPAVTNIVSKITELAQKFADLNPETQKTIVTIAGVAAAIGPLLVVGGQALIWVGKLIPAIQKLKTVMAGLSGLSLGPLAIMAAVITGIVAAVVIFNKKVKEQIEIIENVREASIEAGDSYEVYQQKLKAAGQETEKTYQTTKEYRAGLKDTRSELERMKDELVISEAEYNKFRSELDVGIISVEELAGVLYDLEGNSETARTSIKAAGLDVGYYSDQAAIAEANTMTLSDSVNNAAEAAANYYDYVDLATAGTEDWTAALDGVNDALGMSEAAFMTMFEAAEDWSRVQNEIDDTQDRIDFLMDALEDPDDWDLPITTDEARDEVNLLEGKISELEQQMTDAANRMVFDMMLAATDFTTATSDEIATLLGAAEEMGYITEGALEGVAGNIEDALQRAGTEANGQIAVILEGIGVLQAQDVNIPVNFIKKSDDVIAEIARLKRENITIPVTYVNTNTATERAAGGPVYKHKAYIVGEKGPELFLPDTNGKIVPNKMIDMAKDNLPDYSGWKDNAAGAVKNYYLTANYPKESEMSLIERVKVLEALG